MKRTVFIIAISLSVILVSCGEESTNTGESTNVENDQITSTDTEVTKGITLQDILDKPETYINQEVTLELYSHGKTTMNGVEQMSFGSEKWNGGFQDIIDVIFTEEADPLKMLEKDDLVTLTGIVTLNDLGAPILSNAKKQ